MNPDFLQKSIDRARAEGTDCQIPAGTYVIDEMLRNGIGVHRPCSMIGMGRVKIVANPKQFWDKADPWMLKIASAGYTDSPVFENILFDGSEVVNGVWADRCSRASYNRLRFDNCRGYGLKWTNCWTSYAENIIYRKHSGCCLYADGSLGIGTVNGLVILDSDGDAMPDMERPAAVSLSGSAYSCRAWGVESSVYDDALLWFDGSTVSVSNVYLEGAHYKPGQSRQASILMRLSNSRGSTISSIKAHCLSYPLRDYDVDVTPGADGVSSVITKLDESFRKRCKPNDRVHLWGGGFPDGDYTIVEVASKSLTIAGAYGAVGVRIHNQSMQERDAALVGVELQNSRGCVVSGIDGDSLRHAVVSLDEKCEDNVVQGVTDREMPRHLSENHLTYKAHPIDEHGRSRLVDDRGKRTVLRAIQYYDVSHLDYWGK